LIDTAAIGNRLTRARFARAEIDAADGGSLNLFERPADLIASALKHLELSANPVQIFERIKIAGVRVFGDQRQRSFLTLAANHDGRMRLRNRERRTKGVRISDPVSWTKRTITLKAGRLDTRRLGVGQDSMVQSLEMWDKCWSHCKSRPRETCTWPEIAVNH
jgi:hypothetical protein